MKWMETAVSRWFRSWQEPSDLVRQASKLAQDVGDTARQYAKSGYDGSAQVAWEALRLAQAAGESAPWLAGEVWRLASDAVQGVWDATGRREAEKMSILTTMGFEHQAAEASLKRCSTIEAGSILGPPFRPSVFEFIMF